APAPRPAWPAAGPGGAPEPDRRISIDRGMSAEPASEPARSPSLESAIWTRRILIGQPSTFERATSKSGTRRWSIITSSANPRVLHSFFAPEYRFVPAPPPRLLPTALLAVSRSDSARPMGVMAPPPPCPARVPVAAGAVGEVAVFVGAARSAPRSSLGLIL